MRPQEQWPAWIDVAGSGWREMEVEAIRDKATRRRAGTREGVELLAALRTLGDARAAAIDPGEAGGSGETPHDPGAGSGCGGRVARRRAAAGDDPEEQGALSEALGCETKEQLRSADQDFDLANLRVVHDAGRAVGGRHVPAGGLEGGSPGRRCRRSARKVPGWWHEPRPKAELVKALDAALEANVPRRGLRHLADHPRQRDGGAVRGEGGELDQGVRPRPGHAGRRRPSTIRDRAERREGGAERRGVPHPGAGEPGVPGGPAEVRFGGTVSRRRTCRRWCSRPSAGGTATQLQEGGEVCST